MLRYLGLALLPGLVAPAARAEHIEGSAKVRPAVVTLLARSPIRELLDRIGRETGTPIEVRLTPAAREAAAQRVASGIVIDGEGRIATSASFAMHGGRFWVVLGPGRELRAELVGLDPATDVALLRAPELKVAPAALEAGPGAPPRGTMLCVVGGTLDNRCAQAVGRLERAELNPGAGRMHDFLALATTVPPGSAGAAVVDSAGRVVGMVSAMRRGGGTLAVPAATVARVAAQLKASGEVKRGWLGINVVSSAETRDEHGAGVAVAGVLEGSPAALAGLRAGDRIIRFCGQPVAEVAFLVGRVAESRPGEKLRLGYRRDQQEHEVEVTVGERPSAGVALQIPPDPRGWLGLTTQNLSPALRQRFRAPEDTGILIGEVVEGSPAARAGLSKGDVIVAFGGQPVSSVEGFSAAVRAHRPGDQVQFGLRRGGRLVALTAVVGQRPREVTLAPVQDFHMAFDPRFWAELNRALEALPENRRLRGYSQVGAFLEQSSPTESNRRLLEEIRAEIQKLKRDR